MTIQYMYARLWHTLCFLPSIKMIRQREEFLSLLAVPHSEHLDDSQSWTFIDDSLEEVLCDHGTMTDFTGTHTHTRTRTRTRTHTWTHAHMHAHMHTHTHMHAHMHTHMHTHMRTHMHTHMHTHTCTHTHAHTRMHTHMHTHTCTHTCTHMHTHMHTHAHMHTDILFCCFVWCVPMLGFNNALFGLRTCEHL